MKKGQLITAAAFLLAAITMECNAQPPAPGRIKEDRPAPGPGRQPLQQVTAFNGHAGEWVANDDYVYDGFWLQTATGKSLVKFPPHMGAQLTKLLRAGATVSVNGVQDINPEGVKEIRMLSMTANGQTLEDTPPTTTPVPEQETMVNASGKITALQKGKQGETNGYIVDGKTILRVPPHVAEQLNSLLTTGASVSFTGLKKPPTSGEAVGGNYTVVHCQTITINGTQYMTR